MNKKDDKITDILSRQSLAAAYAYITRISAPGSRENRKLTIRSVKLNQWGFIDANDVPEGKNCGLVLARSNGCWISNESDIEELVLVIQTPRINPDRPNYDSQKTNYQSDILMINGRLYGFCNGPELNAYASNLYRQRIIREDIVIFYLESDRTLYITTNGGRPTRPLLLVNPDTQRLVLDELIEKGEINGDDFDFNTLLDKGCVEYVDPLKQEYIMLSQSIGDLRQFTAEIENTKIILNRMEQLLAENTNARYLSIRSKQQPILLTWDEYQAEIDESLETLNKERERLSELINVSNKELNTHIMNYNESLTDSSKKQRIADLLQVDIDRLNELVNTPQYKYAAQEVEYRITDLFGDLTKYTEITERNLSRHNKDLKEIDSRIADLKKKKDAKAPVEQTYLETQINSIKSELLRLQRKKKYTHCELDPNLMMSVSVSLIPLPDHNQGPRNTYQCSMGRQAIGVYHSNHRYRFDKTGKIMAWPTRPIFETQFNKIIGMDQMGRGQVTVLAIMSYLNYNEEDAIIFNQGAVQRGAFSSIVTKTVTAEIESITTQNKRLIITENFTKDFPRNPRLDSRVYDHLDHRGIARIGSMVKIGDCIVGKVRVITESNNKRSEDESTYIKKGEEGIVDAVIVTSKMVKVKIRELSMPIPGDKFASNHAQKSTIGVMLGDHQMPYIESSGIRPTVIMNPHAIPSRMTIGQLEEMIVSKHGALSGERVDATAYNNFNIDDFKRSLKDKFGYNEWGWETMVDALTGERFKAQIFIGPLYYQRLRHMVREKAQFRARGIRNEFSRAPPAGAVKGGGIRFGEMERDVLMSYGASSLVQEIYCKSSDRYTCTMCTNCHQMAYIDTQKEFVCRNCDDQAQFGQLEIPWSYMLIDRFLTASGIQTRLVTRAIDKPERSSIKF